MNIVRALVATRVTIIDVYAVQLMGFRNKVHLQPIGVETGRRQHYNTRIARTKSLSDDDVSDGVSGSGYHLRPFVLTRLYVFGFFFFFEKTLFSTRVLPFPTFSLTFWRSGAGLNRRTRRFVHRWSTESEHTRWNYTQPKSVPCSNVWPTPNHWCPTRQLEFRSTDIFHKMLIKIVIRLDKIVNIFLTLLQR